MVATYRYFAIAFRTPTFWILGIVFLFLLVFDKWCHVVDDDDDDFVIFSMCSSILVILFHFDKIVLFQKI